MKRKLHPRYKLLMRIRERNALMAFFEDQLLRMANEITELSVENKADKSLLERMQEKGI